MGKKYEDKLGDLYQEVVGIVDDKGFINFVEEYEFTFEPEMGSGKSAFSVSATLKNDYGHGVTLIVLGFEVDGSEIEKENMAACFTFADYFKKDPKEGFEVTVAGIKSAPSYAVTARFFTELAKVLVHFSAAHFDEDYKEYGDWWGKSFLEFVLEKSENLEGVWENIGKLSEAAKKVITDKGEKEKLSGLIEALEIEWKAFKTIEREERY